MYGGGSTDPTGAESPHLIASIAAMFGLHLTIPHQCAIPIASSPATALEANRMYFSNKGAHLLGQHSNPVGQHSNPVGQHSNPVGRHSNPVGQHSNPVGQHSNLVGQHSNPVGQHSNPVGQHQQTDRKVGRPAQQPVSILEKLKMNAEQQREIICKIQDDFRKFTTEEYANQYADRISAPFAEMLQGKCQERYQTFIDRHGPKPKIPTIEATPCVQPSDDILQEAHAACLKQLKRANRRIELQNESEIQLKSDIEVLHRLLEHVFCKAYIMSEQALKAIDMRKLLHQEIGLLKMNQSRARAEIDRLTKNNQDLKDKVGVLEKAVTQQNVDSKRLVESNQDLTKKLTNATSEKKERVSSLTQQVTLLNQQITLLTQKVASAAEEKKKTDSRLAQVMANAQQIHQQAATLTKELADVRTEHEETSRHCQQLEARIVGLVTERAETQSGTLSVLNISGGFPSVDRLRETYRNLAITRIQIADAVIGVLEEAGYDQADPTGRCADSPGRCADRTGRCADPTGRCADRTGRCADPTGVVNDILLGVVRQCHKAAINQQTTMWSTLRTRIATGLIGPDAADKLRDAEHTVKADENDAKVANAGDKKQGQTFVVDARLMRTLDEICARAEAIVRSNWGDDWFVPRVSDDQCPSIAKLLELVHDLLEEDDFHQFEAVLMDFARNLVRFCWCIHLSSPRLTLDFQSTLTADIEAMPGSDLSGHLNTLLFPPLAAQQPNGTVIIERGQGLFLSSK